MTDGNLVHLYSSHKQKTSHKQKKIFAVGAAVLAFCVAALVIILLTNRGLEARIMEIFSVDGPDVSMTRGVEGITAASAGARLHDGYVVFTGEDSICHIRLDTDSLVRMDSHSRISVNRATSTTLSILVEDGQVLIDVQNQHPGHDMEIIIGNFAIGVRGTLFIAGSGGAVDETQILMLEGSVYVDDELPVSAGYVMTLQDDEPFEARQFGVYDLDMFAMQAVLDYRERVLEAGVLTEEDIAWIESMMNIPDYIWIQGVQISTAITSLVIVSDLDYYHWMRDNENVFELSLTNSDVEQLAYMVNLTSLSLFDQQISDIKPLARLINLTGLSLHGNQISDITPLARLMNLTSLGLGETQISDISPLAGLVNLTNLHLWRTQISDISPLEGLTNLLHLSIMDSQIGDISPLAGLTNLLSLALDRNHISDVSPLAGLTSLTHLSMFGNQITDWTPVAHVASVSGRP